MTIERLNELRDRVGIGGHIGIKDAHDIADVLRDEINHLKPPSEVMLWDLPMMVVGYDMANNGDFHVFTVAIPPDFVGEKKFIFASPTKDVEVTVKVKEKALKAWGYDADSVRIVEL